MANNGISVSTDALPLIAKFFGFDTGDSNDSNAPRPPLQAAQNPVDAPIQPSAPTPQLDASQNQQGPTKLQALQRLMNPDVQPPSSSTLPNNPLPPSLVQPPASMAEDFKPSFGAEHPKLAYFLKGLLNTAKNAGPGIGAPTFGQGFAVAAEQPFERQQKQLELAGMNLKNQYAPIMSMLGMRKTQADIGKSEAEAGKATAEAQAIPAKQALEQAQAEAANYKDDPNLGLIDLRTKQPVNPANTAPLTADEAAVLGKQEGDKVPLKLKNTANEIAMRGITTVNTEQGVYERNRQKGTMERLGSNPRNVFAPENRIIPVIADPNNPGAVTLMRAGQALDNQVQTPQSAPAVTAKATARAIAPGGKVGEEIQSFSTAMAHAELLKQAAEALHNNNSRTLSGIANRLKTEFGDPDITNFEAISHVYQNEIQKMIAGGHITNQEIEKNAASLPSNANYETILKVLDSYKSLAKSKLDLRKQGVEKGLKGQANFPQESQSVPANGRPPLSQFEQPQ